MSKKLKQEGGGAPAASSGGGSVTGKCLSDGCGKKEERMGFCTEHYAWFKWGLLKTNGDKPSDFDKKYQAYVKSRKAA